MLAILVTAVGAFVFYLLLTWNSGAIGVWSIEELLTGVVLALIAGLVAGRVIAKKNADSSKSPWRMLNPLRWLAFLVYLIGPFFWAMARANLDVAYRVITGRIRPGIVRLSPGLSTDLGVTLLANSITLTPGTLSVDVDEEKGDLFVHWINVTEPEPSCKTLCGSFPDWVRRIAE
jgi:multicomponent Na+:H+ antiporter subunit E